MLSFFLGEQGRRSSDCTRCSDGHELVVGCWFFTLQREVFLRFPLLLKHQQFQIPIRWDLCAFDHHLMLNCALQALSIIIIITIIIIIIIVTSDGDVIEKG